MELISKTSFSFDLDLIKQDINWIRERYTLEAFPQVCLTHSESSLSNQEKIIEGTGSNYDTSTGKYRYDESIFSIFNKEFETTYLHEVYKKVPDIGRFRIMSMPGPSCYTFHKDLTKRYHIAVDTNPDCLFMFVDMKKNFHIPSDGSVYVLDTRFRHTFINGSKSIRTHLVMDDLSTKRKLA